MLKFFHRPFSFLYALLYNKKQKKMTDITMEVVQRRIVIIDSRRERHKLLQKRLGPAFDYDDYTRGSDAFNQLCHDNADIDMVFVGDDLKDTDAMGMLFMMRKQGFDGIDAVLILDEANAEQMNRGYLCGYDLVLIDGMEEEAFKNVIEWRLMKIRQLRDSQMNFNRYSIAHEKSAALMLSILHEGMMRRLGAEKNTALMKREYMYEMLRSLQQEKGYYRCDDKDIDAMVQASAVYDAGMLFISDTILQAQRPLTQTEKIEVQKHCEAGRKLVGKCTENVALPIVRWAGMMCAYHHERYDGSGYPEGRKGHEIPLPAAVCGIVDAYLALRNRRSWRKAYDADEAMKMIRSGACGMFDPVLVWHLEKTAGKLEGKEIQVSFEDTDTLHQMRTHYYHETGDTMNAVSRVEFLAALSHDIIFEYTKEPSILYLSEHASDKFGLPSVVLHPLVDARIRTILDKDEMSEIWAKIAAMQDHDDRVREDVQINYRGKKQWNRIIAAPTYQNNVLTGCIGVLSNVEREHQMMDTLAFQAVHDPLTGLFNRNHFRVKAKQLLEECPFFHYAFVELDVDHFKQINDTYGHTAGDQVLKRLGRMMKECTRRDDMAVRLGGDEFLLFYNFNMAADKPVQRLFERLKKENQNCDIPFTISCGITTTLMSGREYEHLYQDADRALYEAKKAGRGCYKIYTEEMK